MISWLQYMKMLIFFVLNLGKQTTYTRKLYSTIIIVWIENITLLHFFGSLPYMSHMCTLSENRTRPEETKLPFNWSPLKFCSQFWKFLGQLDICLIIYKVTHHICKEEKLLKHTCYYLSFCISIIGSD